MDKFGLSMGKIGLKIGKFGLKMGRFGLKRATICDKKVTFLDTALLRCNSLIFYSRLNVWVNLAMGYQRELFVFGSRTNF